MVSTFDTTVHMSANLAVGVIMTETTLQEGYKDLLQKAFDGIAPGKYRLIRQLGEGAQGSVYLAEQLNLQRRCAIKVLHKEFTGKKRKEASLRFEQEARIAASITSDYCAHVYDFGFLDGENAYLVMEYVDGDPLDVLYSQEEVVPLDQLVDVFRQIAAALTVLHDAGLVHRDLKPGNILVERKTRSVKLIDFGLGISEGGARMTVTGHVVGTPGFISPEQALGEREITRQADVYALGCVMYTAVTGRLVFEREDVPKMLAAHVTDRPAPPDRYYSGVLPGALSRLILECLRKSPGDRPEGAAAVERELTRISRIVVQVLRVGVVRGGSTQDTQLTTPAFRIDDGFQQPFARESLTGGDGLPLKPASGHVAEGHAVVPGVAETVGYVPDGSLDSPTKMTLLGPVGESEGSVPNRSDMDFGAVAAADRRRRGQVIMALVAALVVVIFALIGVIVNMYAESQLEAESDEFTTVMANTSRLVRQGDLGVQQQARRRLEESGRAPVVVEIADPEVRGPDLQVVAQLRREPEERLHTSHPPKPGKPKDKPLPVLTAADYKLRGDLARAKGNKRQACRYYKKYVKMQPNVASLYETRCKEHW